MCLPCPAALPARGGGPFSGRDTFITLRGEKSNPIKSTNFPGKTSSDPTKNTPPKRRFLITRERPFTGHAQLKEKRGGNPTHPADDAGPFPAPASPVPALFAAKGGFSPPTPAVPAPEGRPTAPFCPGAARLSPGAPRKEAPAAASKPGARPAPEARKRPRVRLFAPFAPVFSAVRRPNARRLPRPPPKPPRRAPPAAPLGHSLRAGNPDFPGQLFHFAVEKRVPQGGIKSLKSGCWGPRPTLA